MIPLTSKQRRELRAQAHPLHPVVSIGQHGLTPQVMHEIDIALRAHALIKVRVFSEDRTDREQMLSSIAEALAAAPVQHLGKLLILWRPPEEAAAKPVKKAVTKPRKRGAAKPRPGARERSTASDRKAESTSRRRRKPSPSQTDSVDSTQVRRRRQAGGEATERGAAKAPAGSARRRAPAVQHDRSSGPPHDRSPAPRGKSAPNPRRRRRTP